MLNLLGALHGVDDGGKVDQEGIADSLDDRAVMRSYGLLNNLIMDVQQPQHAGFIGSHLAAKADDVGEHDRRQPPSLRVHRAAGVVLHRSGLFCWRCLAVNRPLPLHVVSCGLRPSVNGKENDSREESSPAKSRKEGTKAVQQSLRLVP